MQRAPQPSMSTKKHRRAKHVPQRKIEAKANIIVDRNKMECANLPESCQKRYYLVDKEAKERAQKLQLLSELGIKPLSHTSRNVIGIQVQNENSIFKNGKRSFLKMWQMSTMPPEIEKVQKDSLNLHKKYASSLKGFTYCPHISTKGTSRYRYRWIKLPPMC